LACLLEMALKPALMARTLLLSSCLMAAAAAVFGALHDQVSYSLSDEYFTRFKFLQFHLDWWPQAPRLAAACVGALASAWVGALAGVWLAGMCLWRRVAIRRLRGGALLLLVTTLVGAVIGYGLGRYWLIEEGFQRWQHLLWPGVERPLAFLLVGFLHAGSYCGALLGLLLATVFIVRQQPA
jgi:hypothetical protein